MNSKPRRRLIIWKTALLALRISVFPTPLFPISGPIHDGYRAHLLPCIGDEFAIGQVTPSYRLAVSLAQKIRPVASCISPPEVSKFEAFAGSASSSSPFQSGFSPSVSPTL